jgi:lipid II:glycine glycyltransferase (peptidoglycan interpeptide bridge formation enzyme)
MGFQQEVDNFISSEIRPNYTYIAAPPDLLDSRPFKWSGYKVSPAYSYILDLSKGLDHVWEGLRKSLRYEIRKTEGKGVSVEEGSKKELKALYNLMVKRYEEQGKIVTVSKEYLFDLFNSFHPKNFKIFVAKYQGEITTGVIDLWYKDKIITWAGNPKTNISNLSPNDLLFWETVKRGHENGLKQYEIIGAAGVERLHKYYSKCNPDLLLWFSATKYSSFLPKLVETSYFKLLKPVFTKLKLSRRDNDDRN